MKNDSGTTQSVWMSVPVLPGRPKLSEDLHTEILVVGAGLTGLTTAYMLAMEGREVVVIDDGPIAGGETSRTTAHLTNIVDDRYHRIEHVHGEKGVRIVAESHTEAIQHIEAIVENEAIDCDFERLDGYLFLPPGESPDELEREFEAARKAGVRVHWAERAPMDGLDTGRCLRFPDQAQFHPLRYLTGLALAIERKEGALYRDTHASRIEGGPPVCVETEDGFEIIADEVVVATNAPVHTKFKIHTKQAAYRTYVIGMRVPAGSVTKALYYDTPHPYHYARLHPLSGQEGGGEVLIVGGEDHKTGQADDATERWAALEAWTRERFRSAGEVAYRWSGQVLEPVDGVAFIGRDTPHVYLATGDSGMGMTHGTIAGMILTELIAGRDNPWAKLYDPGRISLRAAGEFAKENINVAGKYLRRLTGGDVESVDAIEPGRGAIVREGGRKVAAYRDEGGELHLRSAVCPHLGCIVAWNSAETSWDCPCHGSRFDPKGRVLQGPAISDLEAIHEPATPNPREIPVVEPLPHPPTVPPRQAPSPGQG